MLISFPISGTHYVVGEGGGGRGGELLYPLKKLGSQDFENILKGSRYQKVWEPLQ